MTALPARGISEVSRPGRSCAQSTSTLPGWDHLPSSGASQGPSDARKPYEQPAEPEGTGNPTDHHDQRP